MYAQQALRSNRQDRPLFFGSFQAFVAGKLEAPGQGQARVPRVDHVVDKSPTGNAMYVDVLLDVVDDRAGSVLAARAA